MKRTMRDIAQELGVSRTTVSLVLSGRGDELRIKKETQERILKKVREENFKPSFFAQGLNQQSTRTIGIIFPNVFENFMVGMFKGIDDVFTDAGYSLLLMTTRFSVKRETELLAELNYRHTDGILIVPTCHYINEDEDRSHLIKAVDEEIPLVFMDRDLGSWARPFVGQDDFGGGRKAAEYLINKGAEVFFVVSFALSASSLRERREGFASQREPDEEIILFSQDRDKENLEPLVDKALKKHPGRPGFFVTTSGLAVRLRDILKQRGLIIGRDFDIVRFGSDPEGYTSRMGSLRQPHYEIGRKGASLLLEKLTRKEYKDKYTRLNVDLIESEEGL